MVVSLDQTNDEENMLVPTRQMQTQKDGKKDVLLKIAILLKYLLFNWQLAIAIAKYNVLYDVYCQQGFIPCVLR